MNAILRRCCALATTVLTAAALTACGGSGATGGDAGAPPSAGSANYPFTVTNCGRSTTYTQPPKRALVGWPTTVDNLTALGVGDSVIGYLGSDFAPAPAGSTAPALSPDLTPAAEVVLAAQPDFFLVNADYQAGGSGGAVTLEDLAKIGANVYVIGGYCETNPTGTALADQLDVRRSLLLVSALLAITTVYAWLTPLRTIGRTELEQLQRRAEGTG